MSDTYTCGPGESEDDAEVLEALAALPLIEPPADLVHSFRGRLDARRPGGRKRSMRLVAGIAALLVIIPAAGWWHERQLRIGESQALQSKLDVALQSLSAATRLQAINATVTDTAHGEAIEQALVTALLTDQSTSVRMAAAEALGKVAPPEALSLAVRRALAQENSPFVQMKILSATTRLSVDERRGAITPLLTREHIDPMVISDARSRLVAGSAGETL